MPIYLTIIISLVSSFIFIENGKNDNYSKIEKFEKNYKLIYPRYCHVDGSNISESNKFINCKLGNNKDVKGLLWGDSYAGVLDPFVKSILTDDVSFISRNSSHCFPSINGLTSKNALSNFCLQTRDISLKEISKGKYNAVILAGRWDSMYSEFGDTGINELIKTADYISKNTKLVYVISQPIYYKNSVIALFNRTQSSKLFKQNFERDDIIAELANSKIKELISKSNHSNIVFIDREELYGTKKPQDFSKLGLPYTFDNGHLSEYGSVEFAKNFKKTNDYIKLKEALKAS